MDESATPTGGSRLSRRHALRAGCATLGAMALAGCSRDGATTGTRTTETTGDDSASYQQWLQAPGAIYDTDHYSFSYTDFEGVRANEDHFDASVYRDYAERIDRPPFEQLGVDFGEVGTTLTGSSGVVVRGTFEKDAVTSSLEDHDLAEVDDYEGYTLYAKAEFLGFAVADGTALYATTGFNDEVDAGPREMLETRIDTKHGDAERYTENDDFATLVDELGSGTFVFGRTRDELAGTDVAHGEFAGVVATGATVRVDGGTASATNVQVFADESDIDMDDIEAWTDTGDSFEDADEISASKTGRSAVITARVDTDEYGTD